MVDDLIEKWLVNSFRLKFQINTGMDFKRKLISVL